MTPNVLEHSMSIRKEGYSILKECYEKRIDQNFLKKQLILCDVHVTVITHILKNECKTGPEKSSCFYTFNHLLSIQEIIKNLQIISGGAVSQYVKWVEMQQTFNGAIKVGMIKNFGYLEVSDFLSASKTILCEKIHEMQKSVKLYVVLDALFILSKADHVIEENKSFRSYTFSVLNFSNLPDLYDKNIFDYLKKKIEEFQERDSGWTLKEINFLTVHIHNYNPLRAGSFIELPEFVYIKNACVNIKSDDNLCFKWSVLCALKHLEILEQHEKGNPVKNIRNPNRVSIYQEYEHSCNIDFSDITFPTPPDEIQIFEKKTTYPSTYIILKKQKTIPKLYLRYAVA